MAMSRAALVAVCVLACAAAAVASRAPAEEKWAAFIESRAEVLKPWVTKIADKAGKDKDALRDVAAKRYAKAELAITLAFNDLPMVRHVAREMLTRWLAMANDLLANEQDYWGALAKWMSFGRKGGAATGGDAIGCDGFRNCFLPKGKTAVEYAKLVVDYLREDKLWSQLNVREIVHFIGRFAEPGEEQIYNDAAKQTAGERFVLLKALDPKVADKLTKWGLNKDHLAKEETQCKKEVEDIKKALESKSGTGKFSTFKKGLLSPMTTIMVEARKPDFRAARKLSEQEQSQRPSISVATLKALNKFGLPSFSAGEAGWATKGLTQGGEHQRMGPPSLKWMKETIEHLGAVAAGPSGTTDELLQSYDYTSLSKDAFGGYAGRAMAGATMGPYYHHTLWEIQQGAQMAGRKGVSFVIDKPFDSGVLTPKCASNIAKTTIKMVSGKPAFEVSKQMLRDDSSNCRDFAAMVKNRYKKLTPKAATQWVEEMMYVPFAAHSHKWHTRLRKDGYAPDAAVTDKDPQYKGGTQATEQNALEKDANKLKTVIGQAVCSNPAFNNEPHMKALVFPECGDQKPAPKGNKPPARQNNPKQGKSRQQNLNQKKNKGGGRR